MNDFKQVKNDKLNLYIAFGVFFVSFIVYAMTVQRSFSFWDCGEFIACSYILGIPHPPGTPLFVLIGRIFSIIPFVEDISYRVNYISVISSAFTAMLSYLLTVKIVRYFFSDHNKGINRFIAYIAGITGAFFVAFSRTNWGNSVEAEVYGTALALSVLIVYLTITYLEKRGTVKATKIMVLTFYLALLGVGIHMTVFLVVPICSIFFILKKEATKTDWIMVCGFVIVELLLIILFSLGGGGSVMFYIISLILALVLVWFVHDKINWALLLSIAAVSTIMISFSLYMKAFIVTLIVLMILGYLSNKNKWKFQWKTALLILLLTAVGFTTHAYIPIRSSLNPRIDENNPSRDWRTFVNYLDRKQYGQVSMVDRMFSRRGTWSNQFGRHPHMGFWSYFEEQYSSGGSNFLPFLILGIIGLIVAIRKRLEVGLPFMTLLLMCSAGLILYMNFADGVMFNERTGDAYLEVRDRDYFFTPAFVFFGIAMGLGVAAILNYIKEKVGSTNLTKQKLAVYASAILVLLPAITVTKNYHASDRSNNYLPMHYAKNILDSCEENAILFTSGDNDTFPVWCLQEVYGYRRDVVIVCLSLFNTDWYVEQMKNRYGVPISLTDEQILWYPTEIAPGIIVNRPKEMFNDRPRRRKTFLNPNPFAGGLIRVQDMMVDEIVIENKWERPLYFSSRPYDSPLNLKSRAEAVGILYKLEQNPSEFLIDADKGYDLYMNSYQFGGMESSDVYRDENATGVYIALGVIAVRIYDALIREGRKEEAIELAKKVIKDYPEYWQMPVMLGEMYLKDGDSTKNIELLKNLEDSLTVLYESNKGNIFYMQDLGMAKLELADITGDRALIDEGFEYLWKSFETNSSSNFTFSKLVTSLYKHGRYDEMRKAADMYGNYKRNRTDQLYQGIMGASNQTGGGF